MQNFIRQKNIDHYRRRLAETQDSHERETLKKLLADELAKAQEEQRPPQSKQRDI